MYAGQEEIEAVSKVIGRATFWSCGPEIEEFEKAVAEYVGTKFALAFNSGTSALHTLLLAHDVKGKEVIVPSFTFVATANAVVLAGGIPVFAEAEDETFGFDVEDVAQKITQNTKVNICLHYGGFPAKNTAGLVQLAKERGILLIEDAAESLGSHIGGKMAGSFGASAIFSFCQNKLLSMGEGGVIVTDDEQVYQKAKLLRAHGRVEEAVDYFSSTGDNDYIEPGYNFRISSISAALGLAQLGRIEDAISLRRQKAHYLSSRLGLLKGIRVPVELEGHFQTYQMYSILLENQQLRDGLQKHLTGKGIMSKVYFNPVHLKTIYIKEFGCKEGDLANTEMLSTRVLNLPLFPSMTHEELDYVIGAVEEYFNR